MRPCPHFPHGRRQQRGIVLVIAIILLVVLSLISVASIRGASSTEIATNNARLQALSMQAAEAALRYCELGALNVMRENTETFRITPEPAPTDAAAPYLWQDLANWDGPTSSQPRLNILKDADINTAVGDHAKLYKRPPECMVEYQYSPAATTKRVVVTARGFGPDVPAAKPARDAPTGSEVWLQTTLHLE